MQILSCFTDALSDFPSEAVAILQKLPEQEGMLEERQVLQLSGCLELTVSDLMIRLLPVAASLSVTPISHFKVGAVIEGASGALYLGTNLEFSHQPLKVTVHAEQFAITNAWHKGEHALRRLVVSDAPCGHCRQFINELNKVEQLEVIVDKASLGTTKTYTIQELLPGAFGPVDLGITERLLSDIYFDLELPEAFRQDELAQVAQTAASRSYAPVCQSRAGMALRLSSGKVVTGRYGANAAFNPGISVMEATVVNWRLALMVNAEEKIVEAVMVEQSGVSSQRGLAESFLEGYGIQLRYISV